MMSFPISAPLVIISFFAILSLFSHLLLLNLVLGSSLLIVIYLFKGKEKHLNIARTMASRLPYFMAFLITFGVLSLLFIQALYPSLFYNALINFSLPVFLILVFVLLSYILLYFGAKRWETIKNYKPFLYFAVVVLLSFVMFVFNNIMSFIEDAKGKTSLFLNSKYGFDFYFSNPDLMPRFLHFLFSSVALSGLWVAVWGVLKLQKEPEQGRWQYRSGATYFSSATILVMVTGIWWLLALPSESSKIVLGENIFYTILFVFLILSSLSSFVFALLGMNSIKPAMFLRITGFLTASNVLTMVILRSGFREKQIEGFYDISKNFQWLSFLIFLLILFTAIFAVYNVSKKVIKGTRKK